MFADTEGSIVLITEDFTIIFRTLSNELVPKEDTAPPLPRATNTNWQSSDVFKATSRLVPIVTVP